MSTRFYASLVFICRHLEYRDLTSLLKVSAMSRVVIGTALARRVNKQLSAWVDPDSDFWQTLESAEGVISGSFVLRLLDDDPVAAWKPGSLDIYAPDGYGIEALLACLRRLGYKFWTFTSWPAVSSSRGELKWREEVVVTGFGESDRQSGDSFQTIRIFPVRAKSALEALPYTWSTAHINFVSLNYLVCAYPRATLHHRALVVPGLRKDVDSSTMANLANRGYCVHELGSRPMSDGSPGNPYYHYDADATRHLSDGQSMVLPIQRGVLNPNFSGRTYWPRPWDLRKARWQYCTSSFSLILIVVPRTKVYQIPSRASVSFAW